MTLSKDELQALGDKICSDIAQWFEDYPWDQKFQDYLDGLPDE